MLEKINSSVLLGTLLILLWSAEMGALAQPIYLIQQGRDGYDGCTDAHIFIDKPIWNAGGEDMFEATGNGGEGDAKHALIRFDLSSIPPMAPVDTARLLLCFTQRRTPQLATKELGVYRLHKGWGEGTGDDPGGYDGRPVQAGECNWYYAIYNTEPWDADGCNGIPDDREGTPEDVRTFLTSTPTHNWYGWNITRMIRTWVAHPDSNHGLVLREPSVSPAGGILDFASSEKPEGYLRPILLINQTSLLGTLVGQIGESHTDHSITVNAPFIGDENGDGWAGLEHKPSAVAEWIDDGNMVRGEDSYYLTINDLEENSYYDVRATYQDPDSVYGENPQTIVGIQTSSTGPNTDGIINLAHLDHLFEVITVNGTQMGIVHVYSAYPDYQWVEAPGEGIACVDDAARAVVAYLKHYQYFGDQHSLDNAKLLLRFLFYMQAADGGFYNFIWADHSRNLTGDSSNNNSFNWWACRALWAMGYAYNLFSSLDIEPELRGVLEDRINLAVPNLRGRLTNTYQFQTRFGLQLPADGWLLHNGADVSSEALLGLIYYYEITGDSLTQATAQILGDGISAFQLGSFNQFPFGAHPSSVNNPYLWHGWGSRQTQALALGGRILQNPDWTESARREGDYFFTHLLASQTLAWLTPIPKVFSQINYSISPVVQGWIELYRTTGEIAYARNAGLYAAWWLGVNPHGYAMYDSTTGRCYDGIDPGGVNLNSGAESVVEGLMALQDVLNTPPAAPYPFFTESSVNLYQIQEAEAYHSIESGAPTISNISEILGAEISGGQMLSLSAGDTVRYFIEVSSPYADLNRYYLYFQYLKQLGDSMRVGIQITVDDSTVLHHPEGGGESGNYIWVDHPAGEVQLDPGQHTIDLTYYGTDPSGYVLLDYFILQPVIERRVFEDPGGAQVTIERDFSHQTGIKTEPIPGTALPNTCFLHQNYPNPFNERTTVRYRMKSSGFVSIKIYNLLGEEVVTLRKQHQDGGSYKIFWEPGKCASGIYFCRMKVGDFVQIRKLIFLK